MCSFPTLWKRRPGIRNFKNILSGSFCNAVLCSFLSDAFTQKKMHHSRYGGYRWLSKCIQINVTIINAVLKLASQQLTLSSN